MSDTPDTTEEQTKKPVKEEVLPRNSKDLNWRGQRVQYLRTLKNPNVIQKTILMLAGQVPSDDVIKQLDKLFSSEYMSLKAAKLAAVSHEIVRSIKGDQEKTKKEVRDARLIRHGIMVEMARLHERSDAELLGMFFAVANAGPEKWAGWAAAGAPAIEKWDAAEAAKREARRNKK